MEKVDRQSMEVDIACVGFGPATAGFLKTFSQLTGQLAEPLESAVMPGMPPQVICYERADDVGFGVSGVVTRGRAIRETMPDFDPTQVPTATEVKREEIAYLFDPHGASRKSWLLKGLEATIAPFRNRSTQSFKLPWIPPFLEKHPGYVFSIGQFCSWVAQDIMMSGSAQIWPGTPVAEALIDEQKVKGVRLIDQGVDKHGEAQGDFMPGMDIHAALTVIGDGPIGAISRQLDEHFGLPEGHVQRDWALGMKAVVQLPEGCKLEPGTVLHTLGYPEPEIFGYLYVYPGGVASLGVFVPSWFDHPGRTAYRYLQHWMMHPYLWQHLEGGTLQSWGAKSLGEWGKHGEPHLAGDGYARIGENSGSTNVLTNSGVDEAWKTGSLLAEAVVHLMKEGKPFTRENLDSTYVRMRRESWLEKEAAIAARAREGFQQGFIRGMTGMALAGMTAGRLFWPAKTKTPFERVPSVKDYYRPYLPESEIDAIIESCNQSGQWLHDAFMDRMGWPAIPMDGKLLISQQDALLIGGKVAANPGYSDHVRFTDPVLCYDCNARVCIEACSGQAIQVNPDGSGLPIFEREKCIHCGACLWNCSRTDSNKPELGNVVFVAGSGGLHSAEN
jgi:electron-transferring-flavoprotein dehydrogenase